MGTIHPIENRYGRPEIKRIFEQEYKLQKMLEVEAALARAHAKVGNIPKKDAEAITKRASTKYVKLDRVAEIEAQIRHDVMAVVKAFSEQCGESGKYIHLGATSYDIIDTARALQFKEFMVFLQDDLKRLKKVLLKLAKEHRKTVCIGRTHGQHATPTTYGLKFAIWATEVQRHIDRVNECKGRIIVGKMSGAVGTQAAFGENAAEIQKLVMKDLGIEAAMVSNQIVQRDRYSEFFLLLALIAQTLTKISLEIRNLQRTEIGEVAEGFRKKQVGSSTMPHKRNPIIAERVCGLSRIIKANAIASLDNIPLWHERDLTNSSCERIIIPEICILSDYILDKSVDLLQNLVFNYDNMERNLNLTRGGVMAESMMIALANKGYGRQKAHELMRETAIKSYNNNSSFKDELMRNKEVTKLMSEDEIDSALNPKNYIGTAVEQVDGVLKKLQ